ncbi:hypothetical protein BOTBODRAFT_26178 [Botryobasidium botryosum FD-172 SS1]|uniref:Copper transport protein n=1 Tax=Botryobasidium botryosum (strain FD-172 SS1) TaxID=930990 RepID=A0A067ND88_BOTB1|nr:hypothetical protein BOTBODRAFT_26178 [Botryobasidium botryosum FD-172 SS1]
MDHGMMDHGAMGHGAHAAAARCKMYMLWNTNIVDTCIVFAEWHVRSTLTFLLSLLAVAAIGVGYEWLREAQRKFDLHVATRLVQKRNANAAGGSSSGLGGAESPGEEALLIGRARGLTRLNIHVRVLRAALYGVSVFVSFFIMLIFMTYNAYLILAVVVGAAAGHYVFNSEMDPEAILSGATSGKGVSCH